MTRSDNLPPAQGEIEAMAARAFAALPEAFRAPCAGLVIRVAEFADDGQLGALDLDDAWELTGLYDGRPLTEKSAMDHGDMPDTVWLFRGPILLEWIERESVGLDALVAHVLIHEIAHHFGWSDAEIAQIDRWWE